MQATKSLNIVDILLEAVRKGLQEHLQLDVSTTDITWNVTRKEFEGDYTIVTFPFTRTTKKSPEQVGAILGEYLVANLPEVEAFNVVKGFLNLVVADGFWHRFLMQTRDNPHYGYLPPNGQKVMVEFSSPNTNKPLHLGHIRNILLGWSTSRLLQAAGYEVVKVQIVNDRGIAICKSMLAWEKFGEGSTPASTGIKSDHFVGDYYVLFEQKFQEEYKSWQEGEEASQVYAARKEADLDRDSFFKAYKNDYFNDYSLLGKEARNLVLQWEAGDPAAVALWEKMNAWVYAGFNETYQRLGVSFDKLYFESNTYLLGKDIISDGLKAGVFYQKPDQSVWIDLEDAKLDHKLVLRSDGTSVYMTQDLGTARLRYEDFGVNRMVYVVADEQNYHFKVLFEILKRLGEPYADGLFHLSYGMVDLPTGKMKSREGTVVDADDLMAEVIGEARGNSLERGALEALPEAEREEIIRKIGLAALKFFIIKVHPRKRMVFDPKESVDMQGQTGPYIQNAYVRIQSVLRKAATADLSEADRYVALDVAEKQLIAMVYDFPTQVKTAAEAYDPSVIANYCYDLAKSYHKFYHDFPILKADIPGASAFRLILSQIIAGVLQTGMDLLGIEMPERM